MRVFIVDDEDILFSLFVKYLKILDITDVLCFNNPDEALVEYKKNAPDIVLVDFNIPQFDMNDFLSNIDKSKIIVISGDDYKYICDNVKYQCDFLKKPFTLEQLKCKIESIQ